MPRKDTKREPTRHPGVFRLSSGAWLIEAWDRTLVGRRVPRRKTLDGSLSLQEAARRRAQLVLDLAEDIRRQQEDLDRPPTPPPVPEPPPTTVASYSKGWLKRKSKRLKASVRARYLDVLSRCILPVLGEINVRDLTRAHVEEWVIWAEAQRIERFRPDPVDPTPGSRVLVSEPYAQDTLLAWWRPMVTMLRDAAAEHSIVDPTCRVTPPRSDILDLREQRTLRPEQIRDLLDAIADHYSGWGEEVFLACFSGLRPGELYALHWPDVDEEQGVIHVARGSWRGILGTTKTRKPRDIALTPAIKAILERHRRQQIRAQHPGLAAGIVFPNERGGYRGAPALLKVLRLAGELAGIRTKVGPQVLRRTFNTLLVEAGVNRIVLRGQIGHVDEKMTERYYGGSGEAKREAVEILHRLIDGAGDG